MNSASNKTTVENWLSVPSVPYLEVSNHGRVRESQTKCIILPKRSSNSKYPAIRIGGHKFQVHLLVCEAFHGPKPEPALICRHLDDDPFNMNPENLRWGTRSENTNDMYRNETCLTPLDSQTRISIKRMLALSYTIDKVASATGVSLASIVRIRRTMTSSLSPLRTAAAVLISLGHDLQTVRNILGLEEKWMEILLSDMDEVDAEFLCCQADSYFNCAKPATLLDLNTGKMYCSEHFVPPQNVNVAKNVPSVKKEVTIPRIETPHTNLTGNKQTTVTDYAHLTWPKFVHMREETFETWKSVVPELQQEQLLNGALIVKNVEHAKKLRAFSLEACQKWTNVPSRIWENFRSVTKTLKYMAGE